MNDTNGSVMACNSIYMESRPTKTTIRRHPGTVSDGVFSLDIKSTCPIRITLLGDTALDIGFSENISTLSTAPKGLLAADRQAVAVPLKQYNGRNGDIKMQASQSLRTPSDDGLSQHRQNLGVAIAKLQKAQSTTHRAESISLIHEVIADLLAINNLATTARAASFR